MRDIKNLRIEFVDEGSCWANPNRSVNFFSFRVEEKMKKKKKMEVVKRLSMYIQIKIVSTALCYFLL